MQALVDCPYEWSLELATQPDATGVPLHRDGAGPDIADLVEEAFVGGVLAGKLAAEPDALSVRIQPLWSEEPFVNQVEIVLGNGDAGAPPTYARRFACGRWLRRAVALGRRLRAEGSLQGDRQAFPALLAERRGEHATLPLPLLQAPTIHDQTLEELGVRGLGDESLVPDRPVLVNERMVEEILRRTEEAGLTETGGATLGKIVRLPRPLPGTDTPVVTILSASIVDPRHHGALSKFTFSPEALARADQVAAMRGMGESVLTAFHSHGWGTGCGECNQNTGCAIPQAQFISFDDYQVLESLFPGKATLMPIAGRKLGAAGRRPVLEIHAWRGGRMQPIGWRSYRD